MVFRGQMTVKLSSFRNQGFFCLFVCIPCLLIYSNPRQLSAARWVLVGPLHGSGSDKGHLAAGCCLQLAQFNSMSLTLPYQGGA